MVRGCYEDGTRALSTDHRDVFELNEKRSRLSITPEVDFAIVCGRFTDVSKRHMRRVRIYDIDYLFIYFSPFVFISLQ